jgi:hypothetical protein
MNEMMSSNWFWDQIHTSDIGYGKQRTTKLRKEKLYKDAKDKLVVKFGLCLLRCQDQPPKNKRNLHLKEKERKKEMRIGKKNRRVHLEDGC